MECGIMDKLVLESKNKEIPNPWAIRGEQCNSNLHNKSTWLKTKLIWVYIKEKLQSVI